MLKEAPKPLPYAKTKAIKGRGKNAAFAWKYQNIKKAGSTAREDHCFDKIHDDMEKSMRKTFEIFQNGVRRASNDLSAN